MNRTLDDNVQSKEDPKGPLDNKSSSNNVDTSRTMRAALSKDDLDDLSLRDLIHLEQQFNGYLSRVRAKKAELVLEQLEDLKEQVSNAPRSTTGNSNTLADTMESGLTGIENSDSQDSCSPEGPPTDGPPSL